MKKKKWIIWIAAALIVALLLVVFTANYWVIKKDGQYYLLVSQRIVDTAVDSAKRGVDIAQSGEQIQNAIFGPFDSWAKMKRSLYLGGVRKEYLMARVYVNAVWGEENPGLVKWTDMDNLYEPVAPMELQDYRICWDYLSTTYRFEWPERQENSGVSAVMRFSPPLEEKVDGSDWGYLDPQKLDDEYTVYQEETEEERYAVVYTFYWDPDPFDNKPVKEEIYTEKRYAISQGERLLRVKEYYPAERDTMDVQLLIDSKDHHIEVYIKNLKERPSIEFLTQFGLKKYTGW